MWTETTWVAETGTVSTSPSLTGGHHEGKRDESTVTTVVTTFSTVYVSC